MLGGLLMFGTMKLFELWTLIVFIQITQIGGTPYEGRPDRMTLNEKASRIVKRDASVRPKGWVWCTDKKEDTVFAFKPCPGDPQLEECLKATNVSRNDVLELMEGSWWIQNPAVKFWALCYLSKNGVMSSAGVLSQDVVLRYIPDHDKAEVENTINKCLYKTAHDPVETAWNYLTCFRENQPRYAKIANLI